MCGVRKEKCGARERERNSGGEVRRAAASGCRGFCEIELGVAVTCCRKCRGSCELTCRARGPQ
jgi:hypothetical protein